MPSRIDLDKLLDRVRRVNASLNLQTGSGWNQVNQTSDGSTLHTVVNNVKALEVFEDEVTHLSLCVWSLKDYLKEAMREHDKDPQEIENLIDGDWYLKVSSDLANNIKHGILKRSRSGLFAKMDPVSIEMPSKSLGQITFFEAKIVFDVQRPQEAEYFAPVIDCHGNHIGDAVDILANAMTAWDDAIEKWKLQ
jgi:hypothetical protein